MKNRLIVGIGELLWDIMPDGKRTLGGAPANFAYHSSLSGLRSCVVSAVGDDALGREAVDSLVHAGVDCKVASVEYPTGTVVVSLNDRGVPSYDITDCAAWDNIPLSPGLLSLAQSVSAVCFGSLSQRSNVSRHTIRIFIDALPFDAVKVFDVNLRQHYYDSEIIDWSLRHSNILKLNDEELPLIASLLNIDNEGEMDTCRRILIEYDLYCVVLTCGSCGSVVVTGDGEDFRRVSHVEVVDTVGAGDAFTAAFVSSLIKGEDLLQAHANASCTAAWVCGRKGAMPIP